MEAKAAFQAFQKRIGISFRNESLLIQAFTHSSYVNEQKHQAEQDQDNERLEFLGDAVLELSVSKYLFTQYSFMSEGDMTKLRAAIVCEPSLVQLAQELQFSPLIRLGRGEELAGGRRRPALLADVFEAFIGALYLDQGMEMVDRFLATHLFPKIEAGAFTKIIDYKSRLQEHVQQDNLGELTYEIISEKGPAHNRQFVAQVILNGQHLGQGSGRSKKEAEQRAAKAALKKMGLLIR